MSEDRKLTKEAADLSRRLEAWRRAHRPPTPIPAELWDRAVDLAEEQGLYPTARALHLDYGALKKRVEARHLRPQPSGAQFVEYLFPVPQTIAECALEVESVQGAKLRVDMKNVPPAGLASILWNFVVAGATS